MKIYLFILLALVACAAPQLEEKPTLPVDNRVVDIQETPPQFSAQEKLNKLFMTAPPEEFTINIVIQSHVE